MTEPKSKPLVLLAFFAIYVIWGSTYLLNKIVVTEVQPLFLSSFRFISAGSLIFIISKILKLDLSITKKQFFNCTIAGFLFLVYGNGVFVWALKYVDSGFAALEASTLPLIVLIMMRVIDGKKIKSKSLIGIGLGLGLTGMFLLVIQKELVTKENSIIGMLMILSCVISWAYSSIFVAKTDLPSSYFVTTGYQMLISGIILGFSSLIVGEQWSAPLNWNFKVQVAMILLIIFGSIVAFTAFNYLLKKVSTEKVSTSAYVNPVIALFLGWYILDEVLTLQSIIAATILLTGVYFITSRKQMTTKTKI